MQRNTFRLLVATVLLLPHWAAAAHWPNFRGPQADGFSPETGINKDWSAQKPALLWKVPMRDQGYAGPSVANGRLFIIDHDGDKDIVRALDLRTGTEAWSYGYLDSSKENYGFARATPTIDTGRVYALSRLGRLNCLDEKTGKLIWSKNIVTEFQGQLAQWDLACSPLVDGDKLIVCPGGKDAAVVALNKLTGSTVWQGGGSDKPGYATPVVATLNGTKQYLVFTGFHLIGVEAASGRLLWQVPWRTKYDINAVTPVVVGNKVFIASGYGHGCALITVAGNGAAITWANKELQAHFSSPIHKAGYIYGIGDPGNLVCLELETGKLMWKKSGFEKGGVAGVDGTIIALAGNNGDLVMVELSPTAYKELGRMQPLGGQSWTAPIVADGKLIIRNKEALACLDLQARQGK